MATPLKEKVSETFARRTEDLLQKLRDIKAQQTAQDAADQAASTVPDLQDNDKS